MAVNGKYFSLIRLRSPGGNCHGVVKPYLSQEKKTAPSDVRHILKDKLIVPSIWMPLKLYLGPMWRLWMGVMQEWMAFSPPFHFHGHCKPPTILGQNMLGRFPDFCPFERETCPHTFGATEFLTIHLCPSVGVM